MQEEGLGSMQPDVYPGSLRIWKNKNLTEQEQLIEQRFAEQLQEDLPGWFAEYHKRFGRVLDTDRARELCEEWRCSPENRARFSSAVQFPASQFVAALYQHWLTTPAQVGQDIILFMAGGGGSGKTTVIDAKFPQIRQNAHIVYDTTLSNQEEAERKIDLARQSGLGIGISLVQILYVYRPFENAVRGVIERAIEQGGRTVPLDVLVNDHIKAPQTALHLLRKYPRTSEEGSTLPLRVYAIDNSAEQVSQARIVLPENTVEFLEQVAYNKDELRQIAQKVLDDEIRTRREYGQGIAEYIVEALLRSYVRR